MYFRNVVRRILDPQSCIDPLSQLGRIDQLGLAVLTKRVCGSAVVVNSFLKLALHLNIIFL